MTAVPYEQRGTASAPPTKASRHPLLARHHAHDGWLFPGRVTRLHLRANALIGNYADIGVLLPGFDPGVEWFTRIWGDDLDDVLAVQLDESVTGPLPRLRHEGIAPLSEHVEGLKEYRLDGPIAERLGMELLDHHDYRFANPGGILREVGFHDNCGSHVRPAEAGVLRAMARQHLALHEEYHGVTEGLMTHVDPLCDLLETGEPIALRSRPGGILKVTIGQGMFDKRSLTWRVARP
jgi:hypothetical protein